MNGDTKIAATAKHADAPPTYGKYRQAIVVVHGMGSQRPLDSSLGFIATALKPVRDQVEEFEDDPSDEAKHVANKSEPGGQKRRKTIRRLPPRRYYSIPDRITGSYDSRVLVAPRAPTDRQQKEERAQTDFYEYHWAHLMQGNRLADLLPTTVRLLFTRWRNVPYGITWLWALCWMSAIAVFGAIVSGRANGLVGFLPDSRADLLARIGFGVLAIPAATVLGALITAVSGAITSSFVDVTRYLDTSPRSYAQRREIRQGFVRLLEQLHEDIDEEGNLRYRRIIVVGHSLGAFIAYDGIATLWGKADRRLAPEGFETSCTKRDEETKPKPDDDSAETTSRDDSTGTASRDQAPCTCPVCVVEQRSMSLHRSEHRSIRRWRSKDLPDGGRPFAKKGAPATTPPAVKEFQDAQRELWHQLAAVDHSWRVSDLITVGTPMYFADRLIHRQHGVDFLDRVARRELAVCPPVTDDIEWSHELGSTADDLAPGRVTWVKDRRVLHQGAVFAVVRWSNCYFPARSGFFGDWFGGPVSMLFGYGINDIAITGNRLSWRTRRARWYPGVSHAWYYRFPDQASNKKNGEYSVADTIRRFLDLASEPWTPKPVGAKPNTNDDSV